MGGPGQVQSGNFVTEYSGTTGRRVEDLGDPPDPVGHEVQDLRRLFVSDAAEVQDDQDVPVAGEEVELLDLGERLERARRIRSRSPPRTLR